MSDGIKIIAEDENSDKAQTNVGLRKSELDFLYDLVVGKATVKAKNGRLIRLPAQSVQGKFYGNEKVISEQLQQRGFIYKPVACDKNSVMFSITGAKTENEGKVENEVFLFSHKDGYCYPSASKGTWNTDDRDAYHRVYTFDKNYEIKKYKPDYLGDEPLEMIQVLDKVDEMSKYRLDEKDRNRKYVRKLEFEGGYPLWKPFAFGEVKIKFFSGNRELNFKQAREEMAEKLNKRYPDHNPTFTADMVEDWMNDPEHEMTWEESPNGTLYKVPSLLHNNVYHKGGQNQFRGEANEVLLSDNTIKPNMQNASTGKTKSNKKTNIFKTKK